MIGEKTKDEGKRLLSKLIDNHWAEIKEAYIKTEKGLSIGLTLVLIPESLKTKVQVGINFVADRIKDAFEVIIDEKQEELFKAIKPIMESIRKEEMSITYEGTTIDKGGVHED